MPFSYSNATLSLHYPYPTSSIFMAYPCVGFLGLRQSYSWSLGLAFAQPYVWPSHLLSNSFCYPLPTTYYLLPTTHYPLPTTQYPLPIAYYPLHNTYSLLLTVHHLMIISITHPHTTYYLATSWWLLRAPQRICLDFWHGIGSAICMAIAVALALALAFAWP